MREYQSNTDDFQSMTRKGGNERAGEGNAPNNLSPASEFENEPRIERHRIVGSVKQLTSKEKRSAKLKKNNERRRRNKISESVSIKSVIEAYENNLFLNAACGFWKTTKQYNLSRPGKWLLEIHPGTRRLVYDKRQPGPIFHVKDNWNLLDVVKAVIEAEEKNNG